MLVFNFVQSDMAFLPVVAPDSFIEVATLRAMKIPTGWNEMNTLCISVLLPNTDFTKTSLSSARLRSLFRLFRTWSSAIVSGGRQSICQRGSRDGIWTCSVKSPMAQWSSDIFRLLPKGLGFHIPDPRLHHLLFTLPYSSCTRLVRHLCYQYKIFGTVNRIWCTECPNCLCPNLGPH